MAAEKARINIVVIGHISSGKSTTTGHSTTGTLQVSEILQTRSFYM